VSQAEYMVDSGVSRFTVRGVAGGMLSGLGHNPVIGIRDFTGTAGFDPDSPERTSLRVAISTAALEVQNNASEKDRREMKRVMDEEVLETALYPNIVFEAAAVKASGDTRNSFRAELEGNLSLHGITRPFRVPAQISVMGDMLRANGEFSLLLSDFRIKPPTVAGGAIKLKDELKLSFDIVARPNAGNMRAAG
jgi:polyisoprenoid-binding protein YceI